MADESFRILLVEDNPGDARLLQGMLSTSGGEPFDIVHATHLNQAIGLLERDAFHAVILDLGLPDSNGMSTVDRTREPAFDCRVPIIVVTGEIDEEQADDALRHGALDYLAKNDLQPENLVRTLRYAIQRQRTRNSIEDADLLRRQFLANMSHELRTPLNSIIGYSDMMRHGILGELQPPPYAEYVDSIHKSGMQLLALIDDLLDLSKAENRMLAIDEKDFNLTLLAGAAAGSMMSQVAEREIRMSVSSPNGSVWLNGDAPMIRQVLLNLVSNAIKFTPANGDVTVEIGVNADSSVRLVVRDSGIGMPREEIERAFDAYLQVADPYSRKGDRGTGVGLALTKHFVELHNGTILLESEVGLGTQVTVTFPASRTVSDGIDGLRH